MGESIKKEFYNLYKSPISSARFLLKGDKMGYKKLRDVNFLEYKYKRGEIKNIAITYKCNNNCEYCKNEKTLLLGEGKPDMTKDEFIKALDWHETQGLKQVIITGGGEPTMNPLFKEFLSICKERGFQAKVNTNLLFSDDIAEAISSDMVFELIAHYKTHMEDSKHKVFEKNLRKLRAKNIHIKLRYNIYRKDIDNRRVLRLGRKYGIEHVDLSVPHPSDMDNQKEFTSIDHIRSNSSLVASFVKDIGLYGMRARFVKPVPMCLFNEKDREFLIMNAEMRGVCSFNPPSPSLGATVIHPGLKISWCNADFSMRFMETGQLEDHRDNKALLDSYADYIEYLCWKVHLFPECRDCDYNHKRLCHGGCLVYKFSGEQKIMSQSEYMNQDEANPEKDA